MDKLSKLNLLVTNRCDKACVYCDFPLVKERGDVKLSVLQKWLPKLLEKLEKGGVVSIVGGEPGLVNSAVYEYIFSECAGYQIEVCTNGLFVERYAEYCARDDVILLYHNLTHRVDQRMAFVSNFVNAIVLEKGNISNIRKICERI